ncbi:MAG: hypothetical protein Q8K66_07285 [Sediminibacterium sp.]|nr:hypothetical protein [Sediminibacterium sp.]MDP3128697.1 hypothetical protein [Sediminibacterium sp.]
MKIFFTVSILIVFLGCTKTVTNQILQKEDILLSEISEWGKWYEKAIPNAPKLLITKAEKTFF